jgi:hypothetical protein
VGARNDGSAYVWARNLSGLIDWQQLSTVREAGSGSGFGQAVALSSSAMEIVIGGQRTTHISHTSLQS